jgi:hypothetical protein
MVVLPAADVVVERFEAGVEVVEATVTEDRLTVLVPCEVVTVVVEFPPLMAVMWKGFENWKMVESCSSVKTP